jgi:NAD(P)-dependent dehydrogenase (short-subunit alcohol dehydrogenase family)
VSTWLITGANRGLGLEIARAALGGGENVVVGARKPDSVPSDVTESDRALAVALDVTDRGSVEAAVTAATERFDGIDVLVNNAGYGFIGAFEETADAEERALFDVNVFGLIAMTRAVLPQMREAGRGRIVNIGSRGGFEGNPGVSAYCASKFAVEALDGEVRGFGVRCMVVEPGSLRTDFWTPARCAGRDAASAPTTARRPTIASTRRTGATTVRRGTRSRRRR